MLWDCAAVSVGKDFAEVTLGSQYVLSCGTALLVLLPGSTKHSTPGMLRKKAWGVIASNLFL